VDEPHDEAASAPRIDVQQLSQRPGAQSGEWIVGWSVKNLTADALTLESAWLPHGQFRCERTALPSAATLEAGAVAEIELNAHYAEAPVSVVENAFLILTARWRNHPWRILARLTVRIADDGGPETETETMTIQQVGFSERREPSVE
jgi:hypothetical protein